MSCKIRNTNSLEAKITLNVHTHAGNLPVIGQKSIAENEPPSLVTFNVISPFEEPTLVGISLGWSRGLRLRHRRSSLFHEVNLKPGVGEKRNGFTLEMQVFHLLNTKKVNKKKFSTIELVL